MAAKKKQSKKKSAAKSATRATKTVGTERAATDFGPVRIASEHAAKIAEYSKNMMANIQSMLNEAGIQQPVHTVALASGGADPCDPWPCGPQRCCYNKGVLCCR